MFYRPNTKDVLMSQNKQTTDLPVVGHRIKCLILLATDFHEGQTSSTYFL